MADLNGFKSPVTRFYVDVRPYAPAGPFQSSQTVNLPYIETLPQDIQTSVKKFLRPQDKLMSLSSALLKYLFIHRTTKLPWSQIHISRTPKPHGRPFWDPPPQWHGDGFQGLEFNVSHQAGIVVLLGCQTPHRSSVLSNAVDSTPSAVGEQPVEPNPIADKQSVKVGVDIACTKEYRRTPDFSTQAKVNEWVDTFAEMFSQRERRDMKDFEVPAGRDTWAAGQSQLELKARRFYTYWALKEAYIKMVGEGLLADWLRDLEFVNVIPPNPNERQTTSQSGLKVVFKQQDVTDAMITELEGIEETFILASMLKGVDEQVDGCTREWIQVDFERDIGPCATGTCSCMD